MGLNICNAENYNIIDQYPEKKLEDILLHSKKAQTLLARNKKIIDNRALQMFGAVHMLEGLEYHYNNFVKSSNAHEAIAYLNRLGQYREFFEHKCLGEQKTTIKKFLKFRDNYSAHRSIDRENSKKTEEREYCLEFCFSIGFMRNGNNQIFQYIEKNGKVINFDLINDHQKIMDEAYKIFENVLKSNKK